MQFILYLCYDTDNVKLIALDSLYFVLVSDVESELNIMTF